MTGPAENARAPAWTVRVRGRLGGACARRYGWLHPRVERDCTLLRVSPRPGGGLVEVLLDLQAYGLEVVDIERSGTAGSEPGTNGPRDPRAER